MTIFRFSVCKMERQGARRKYQKDLLENFKPVFVEISMCRTDIRGRCEIAKVGYRCAGTGKS